jgi:hypothetical protein
MEFIVVNVFLQKNKTKLLVQNALWPDLPQLRRRATGRRRHGSFSLRFSELTLNFLRARADDKESAIWELSRHSANEIGIGGMERR